MTTGSHVFGDGAYSAALKQNCAPCFLRKQERNKALISNGGQHYS